MPAELLGEEQPGEWVNVARAHGQVAGVANADPLGDVTLLEAAETVVRRARLLPRARRSRNAPARTMSAP